MELWDRKLGGPQSWYGRCGEKKKLTTEGKQNPAIQLVARCFTDCAVLTIF
jgi:hypothetical protein